MRSRGQLEIATPGSSSWMPGAPQGVKGFDDDDDDELVIKMLRVVFFVMSDIPASEFYVQTFRNTMSVPSSKVV